VVLIPDLEDGVAYASFLNGLRNKRFKFSPAKQKETSWIEALRKITDFIRAIEIYAETTDTSRKAKTRGYRNAARGDKRPRINVGDSRFTSDPRSILMEVGHPMLKKPQLITTASKPHSTRKYYEFRKQNGHTTAEFRE